MYFANKTEEFDQRADKLLRGFWEIEDLAIGGKQVMSKEDEKAMSLVKTLNKWVDGRYEVSIPWKDNKVKIQNDYSNAVSWLESTEEKVI